jgi:DNA primase
MFRNQLPKIRVPIEVSKAKSVSIVDLYKKPLKKTGKALMGPCPFHNEKNPSFAIYPETNSFYCFAGCGGGDVIEFYKRLHNCSFQTAIEELSK